MNCKFCYVILNDMIDLQTVRQTRLLGAKHALTGGLERD